MDWWAVDFREQFWSTGVHLYPMNIPSNLWWIYRCLNESWDLFEQRKRILVAPCKMLH